MKVIEESLSLTGDQATLLARGLQLLHRGQTPPGLDPGQHGQPEVLCRGSPTRRDDLTITLYSQQYKQFIK